jgi:hypothetical protein
MDGGRTFVVLGGFFTFGKMMCPEGSHDSGIARALLLGSSNSRT